MDRPVHSTKRRADDADTQSSPTKHPRRAAMRVPVPDDDFGILKKSIEKAHGPLSKELSDFLAFVFQNSTLLAQDSPSFVTTLLSLAWLVVQRDAATRGHQYQARLMEWVRRAVLCREFEEVRPFTKGGMTCTKSSMEERGIHSPARIDRSALHQRAYHPLLLRVHPHRKRRDQQLPRAAGASNCAVHLTHRYRSYCILSYCSFWRCSLGNVRGTPTHRDEHLGFPRAHHGEPYTTYRRDTELS